MRQVLALLAEGHSEKQVAAMLKISPHTVHDYVKMLHHRLDVSSRGELLARSRELLGPALPEGE
jgi:DNA-binding CsgD family transcriptional regulator